MNTRLTERALVWLTAILLIIVMVLFMVLIQMALDQIGRQQTSTDPIFQSITKIGWIERQTVIDELQPFAYPQKHVRVPA